MLDRAFLACVESTARTRSMVPLQRLAAREPQQDVVGNQKETAMDHRQLVFIPLLLLSHSILCFSYDETSEKIDESVRGFHESLRAATLSQRIHRYLTVQT